VQIIGTKRHQDTTIRLLHRLGVVQLEAWSEARLPWQQRIGLSDEAVLRCERLAYMATRVEALLASLPGLDLSPSPEYEDYSSQPPEELLRAVEADLAHVGPEVQALVTRRSQLEEQRGTLARYEATLRQLLPLVPALVNLEHYAVTAAWVERRYRVVLDMLAQQLEGLTAARPTTPLSSRGGCPSAGCRRCRRLSRRRWVLRCSSRCCLCPTRNARKRQ
jgi:hypothetical protein